MFEKIKIMIRNLMIKTFKTRTEKDWLAKGPLPTMKQTKKEKELLKKLTQEFNDKTS